MWERVHDPGTYQAFQHFLSHAPWDHTRIWRQLRATIPDRSGMVILDGTSFPKQGTQSVGVARRSCGTLGKVANCQVAVTAALWTGVRAWMLGAALYVPETWLTSEARARAKIPTTVRFQEKWRLALTLLRQARAAGFQITAVLGDAEFGDNRTLRQYLDRSGLAYALGVSSTVTVSRAGAAPVNRCGPWPRSCRAAPGASSRGATAPTGPGRRTVPPSARPPPLVGLTGSRQKSGSSSSAILERPLASKPTSSRCRRPPRCAPSSASPITAGRSNSNIRNSRTNWG